MNFTLQKTFLTLNSYNFNSYNSENCNINVQIKDYNNNPILNKSVDIYLDDILIDTITTDNNGTGTLTHTFSSRNDIGLHSIRANESSVKLKVYFDSGWQSITFNSNYEHYSSTQELKYRVVNNVVEIRGEAKNKAARNTSGEAIGNIPSQYAPTQIVRVLQQGSGANKFLMSINTNGELTWARYGTNSNVTSLSASSWLCVGMFYTI